MAQHRADDLTVGDRDDAAPRTGEAPGTACHVEGTDALKQKGKGKRGQTLRYRLSGCARSRRSPKRNRRHAGVELSTASRTHAIYAFASHVPTFMA